jgi:putative peptidoglycan lipid II flippase
LDGAALQGETPAGLIPTEFSMSEQRKLIRATGIISLATFASRILGLIRESVIAYLFGAGLSADAFFVAFRIPNMLRRLLAEGSLSASFIPVFTEYRQQRGKRQAWELASTAISIASVILVLVAIAGIVAAPLIVKFIAPGFKAVENKQQLTILLTRIIFPYIFCIGLAALFMGILNSLHHFFAPALSPALLNICIITSALYLAPRLAEPVVALAIGVVLGGVVQLVFQLPYLKQKGMRFRFSFDFKHPGVRRVGQLMLPAMLGLAVYEVNGLVDTLLASFLPPGSVSYLNYGNRLVQFPLGLFGIALGTAILPTLSRQAANGDLEHLKDTFSLGLRLVLFVSTPAMVGLMILGEPIIQLLFQRGEFGYSATVASTQALFYYAVGLCAYAGVKVTVPVFYALQDTKTPVKISIVAMIVNIFLNLILMVPLKHGGLALATALSSMLNMGWLIVNMRRRLGRLGGKKIFASFIRIALASAVMGVLCWLAMDYFSFTRQSQWLKAGLLGGCIITATGVFLLLSHWLGSEELLLLKQGFLASPAEKRGNN